MERKQLYPEKQINLLEKNYLLDYLKVLQY